MPDYAALIERLEKLDGPDREVDLVLAQALVPDVVTLRYDAETNTNIPHTFWEYTRFIDDAVALVERVLPGWSWRVATCCVSDDAWVQPDFNCPVHGERVKREFNEATDWVEITDVDLRPSGRPAIALLIATLKALQETSANER